jgi:RHS repeat-associated protein
LTPHSGTNVYFHVTATPWPNGAINTLSNLVGLPTITYGADGEGRMSTVSASSGQNPVTSVSYNPASQLTGVTYGSSDTDSFTYFSTTGRMQTYTYSMGSTPKTDSGTMNWNSNGTLLSLTITDQINTANTQTCNYTHDALGRIASANCGTAIFNQNFSYDPFGNITKTVPTGSTGTAFGPTYDYTNYTNRMTSTPFTYNGNNGAVTADGSHGFGWDTENRVSTVDSGASNGVCITYDALDRVVEQATGSSCSTSFKEIVYSPSGAKLAQMNGSTLLNAVISLPGGAQAVYGGSVLQFYRHRDWLGSSRLATTPSRTCYWDIAYAPFGENYVPPATGCVAQDLNFTGQNQDTETSVSSGGQGGLFDFMFRKHSPVQGRWLSPDPAGLAAASPADPQTWNRYAYVANRPTNSIDGLGLLIICCAPGGGGGGPCDPFFDPFCCDPVFGCICLDCGGGGGPKPPPPGREPPSPPPPVRRVGGVWPENETTGLPAVPDTSPFDQSSLFSFLPGLNCGSSGGVSGFGFTQPVTVSSGGPCAALEDIIALALVSVASENASNTDKKTDSGCTPTTLRGAGFLDYCADHSWTVVAGYVCEGDRSCCATGLSNFKTGCHARNDSYDKKAGVERYAVIDRSNSTTSDAVCCKKW